MLDGAAAMRRAIAAADIIRMLRYSDRRELEQNDENYCGSCHNVACADGRPTVMFNQP
jgi:hypothetical protein